MADNTVDQMSKEELIAKIRSMQTHIDQLRNIINKRNPTGSAAPKKAGRVFDFRKYKRRHIALKFLYLGWDYHGYVVQDDTDNTIERHLFEALAKTRLVEDRQTSNYHRCGRTDKGVSAFSQVVSLDVRSNVLDGRGVFEPEDYTGRAVEGDAVQEEINYCGILNRVLPAEIRCIAWAPVDRDFSARFDCISRTYKYFLPRGTLDVELMRAGAGHLLGEHDFRNLCKMDVKNGVTNYTRVIKTVSIELVESSKSEASSYQLIELTIEGSAFLWHQIRCIVELLLLIGEAKEEPGIILKLLDIEACPRKPNYNMANEVPLVLFETSYDQANVAEWHTDKEALLALHKHLQSLWTMNAVKATMIRAMIDHLPGADSFAAINNQHTCIGSESKHSVHKPLLERHFCESLEERLEKTKRPKLF